MRGDTGSQAKCTVPLYDKVFVTEVLQDRSQNLIAAGLRSSVVIIELQFEDPNRVDSSVDYEIVQKINHDSRVQCLAWSPQTTLAVAPRVLKFATGGADHNVRIFTSDLGQNESLRVLSGHRDYVNSVAFHPEEDGGQLVSGSDDHTVALWDTNSGQHLHTITFRSAVMAVSWHPEEVSKLMIAEKNAVVHMFNIVSYHPILSLDCGTGPLSSADWSLSNSLLIAVAIRSDVSVWDLSKMAAVHKKYVRQDVVKAVKMAPFSDTLMATAGQPNYSVKVSSTKNAHLTTVMANEPIGGISWHPRRNLLVVGHDEKISVHYVSSKQS